jgi:hypothetical protein
MKNTKVSMLALVVFASIGAAFATSNPFVAQVRYRVDANWAPIAVATSGHECETVASPPPCTSLFDNTTTPPTEINPTLNRRSGNYQP